MRTERTEGRKLVESVSGDQRRREGPSCRVEINIARKPFTGGSGLATTENAEEAGKLNGARCVVFGQSTNGGREMTIRLANQPGYGIIAEIGGKSFSTGDVGGERTSKRGERGAGQRSVDTRSGGREGDV
jgi:hypothetical protein